MTPLQEHFDAYLENALSERDEEALGAWLLESRDHVDEFVRDTFLHWQLLDVAGQKARHADVMAAAPRDSQPAAMAYASSRPPVKHDNSRRRRPLFALAAAIAVVAAGLGGYVALRPDTVGQLSKASPDARWQAASGAPRVGALLRAGQTLRLERGRALATLVSGARLILEGPGEVRVDGENRLWLQSGRLGVEVPAQATGLVVDSPLGRFVDLGTDFTIDLDPEAGCQLHVFSGMVEFTPPGSEGQPVRVSLGSAVSYNPSTGDVSFLPYDAAQQLEL
jgi:hypothetical protein